LRLSGGKKLQPVRLGGTPQRPIRLPVQGWQAEVQNAD
jgi:hypothetical protein